MAQNNLEERLAEIFRTLEKKDIPIPPRGEYSEQTLAQTNTNVKNSFDFGEAGYGLVSKSKTNNVTSIIEGKKLDLESEVIPIKPAIISPATPAPVVPTTPAPSTIIPVTPTTPAPVVPVPATPAPVPVVPVVPVTPVPAVQPIDGTSSTSIVLGSGMNINVSPNPTEGNKLTNNNNNLVLKAPVVKGEGSPNSYSIPLGDVMPFLNNNKIQTPKDLEKLLSPGVINLKGTGFDTKNVKLEFQNGKPFVTFDAVPKLATAVDANFKGETFSGKELIPNAQPTFKGEINVNLTPGVGGSTNSVFKDASIEANYNNGQIGGSAKITAKTVTEKPEKPTEAFLSLPAFYLTPEVKDKFLGIKENEIKTQPQIKQR